MQQFINRCSQTQADAERVPAAAEDPGQTRKGSGNAANPDRCKGFRKMQQDPDWRRRAWTDCTHAGQTAGEHEELEGIWKA